MLEGTRGTGLLRILGMLGVPRVLEANGTRGTAMCSSWDGKLVRAHLPIPILMLNPTAPTVAPLP